MKKVIKALVIIIAIILVIAATIGIFIWTKLNKINYEKVSKEDIEISAGVEENLKEYRNIAIFGIDTRENTYSGSRTDCIIIASINQNTKEVKLVSVYRDTYLDISRYGLDKVNHAYAYGGAALSMSTLNTNLDLDITEFVTVNFESTKDIIDKMGGVEITVTSAEASQIPGIKSAGTYNLTGEQALAYGRIRKIDSDYARTERMRTVLTEVFNKAKKMSVTDLNNVLDKVLPEVYTNITKSDILTLIQQIA